MAVVWEFIDHTLRNRKTTSDALTSVIIGWMLILGLVSQLLVLSLQLLNLILQRSLLLEALLLVLEGCDHELRDFVYVELVIKNSLNHDRTVAASRWRSDEVTSFCNSLQDLVV